MGKGIPEALAATYASYIFVPLFQSYGRLSTLSSHAMIKDGLRSGCMRGVRGIARPVSELSTNVNLSAARRLSELLFRPKNGLGRFVYAISARVRLNFSSNSSIIGCNSARGTRITPSAGAGKSRLAFLDQGDSVPLDAAWMYHLFIAEAAAVQMKLRDGLVK